MLHELPVFPAEFHQKRVSFTDRPRGGIRRQFSSEEESVRQRGFDPDGCEEARESGAGTGGEYAEILERGPGSD